MLKTQKLFEEMGHVEAIKFLTSEPLNIKAKEYENFYVLNYDQIFSPETDDYVMECRSLQIAKDGTIISRAFPRFFNYGQRPEITGKFDFDSAMFYEKADGSLIRVYWNPFDNRWEIATRGTAFAESEHDFYPTFRQAVIEDGFGFEGCPNGTPEQFFQAFCSKWFIKSFTYVFEYCSMKNNIVTPYAEPQMILLSIIKNETGDETPLHITKEYMDDGWIGNNKRHVRLVKLYNFDSYNDMKVALDNLPDLQEGFVAQDKNGLRVKFKNELYLKLHKMRGDLGFTEKKIASVVAQGEEDEVLTYFGQYKHLFEPIIKSRDELMIEIQRVYNKNMDKESQKDFALSVKDYPYSALLFNMRKGKSFIEVWNEAREDYKVELILNKVWFNANKLVTDLNQMMLLY